MIHLCQFQSPQPWWLSPTISKFTQPSSSTSCRVIKLNRSGLCRHFSY
ncbi:hypothetical protein V6Z11_A09G073100 [Gossypium hirsutum]